MDSEAATPSLMRQSRSSAEARLRKWWSDWAHYLSRFSWIPHVVALTMLLRIPGMALVSVGQMLAVVVLPLSARAVRRVDAVALMVLLALSALSGVVALAASRTWLGLQANVANAAEVLAWPFALTLGGIAIAWCVTVLGARRTLAYIALAGLVDFMIIIWDWSNPWKFGVGQFVTLAVLVFLWNRPRRYVLLAMLPLMIISAATATRGLLLMQLAALLVVFLSFRSTRTSSTRWRVEAVITICAVGIALAGAPAAAEAGWFGSAIKERTMVNTQGGESVILGGRLEWVGAVPLFQSQPWGYGLAVQPSEEQKRAVYAKTEPLTPGSTGYFSGVVFGPRVDLHSSVLNAWFHFGVIGLVWAIWVFVLLAFGLASIPMGGREDAALAFVIAMSTWHFVYSPLLASAWVSVGLGIALTLIWRRASTRASGATLAK